MRHLPAFCFAAALALTGCTSTGTSVSLSATTQAQISQALTDVSLIDTAIQAEMPAIQKLAGLNAATMADITKYAAKIQTEDTALKTAFAATGGTVLATGSVSAYLQDVSALIGDLQGVALPPDVQQKLQAAQVLIPVIQLAVGLMGAQPAAAAPQPGTMQPPAARMILAAPAPV